MQRPSRVPSYTEDHCIPLTDATLARSGNHGHRWEESDVHRVQICNERSLPRSIPNNRSDVSREELVETPRELAQLRTQLASVLEILSALADGHVQIESAVELVRRGRFEEANAALRSRENQALADQLALKPIDSAVSFAKNMRYLNEHRDALRGQWVALLDGELIESDGKLRGLHSKLDASGRRSKDVLITQVE
jgi:hypothetical protein